MEEEKALQLYLECYKDYLSLGLQRTLGQYGGLLCPPIHPSIVQPL